MQSIETMQLCCCCCYCFVCREWVGGGGGMLVWVLQGREGV